MPTPPVRILDIEVASDFSPGCSIITVEEKSLQIRFVGLNVLQRRLKKARIADGAPNSLARAISPKDNSRWIIVRRNKTAGQLKIIPF